MASQLIRPARKREDPSMPQRDPASHRTAHAARGVRVVVTLVRVFAAGPSAQDATGPSRTTRTDGRMESSPRAERRLSAA